MFNIVQVGFAALIVFGIVGNFTGHRDAAILVTVVTVICWGALRILLEGLIASVKLFGSSKKPAEKGGGEPPFPPTAPA